MPRPLLPFLGTLVSLPITSSKSTFIAYLGPRHRNINRVLSHQLHIVYTKVREAPQCPSATIRATAHVIRRNRLPIIPSEVVQRAPVDHHASSKGRRYLEVGEGTITTHESRLGILDTNAISFLCGLDRVSVVTMARCQYLGDRDAEVSTSPQTAQLQKLG